MKYYILAKDGSEYPFNHLGIPTLIDGWRLYHDINFGFWEDSKENVTDSLLAYDGNGDLNCEQTRLNILAYCTPENDGFIKLDVNKARDMCDLYKGTEDV